MPPHNLLINYIFQALKHCNGCAHLCQAGLLEELSTRTVITYGKNANVKPEPQGEGDSPWRHGAKQVKRLVFHESQQESKMALQWSLDQSSCWVC